MRDVSILIGGKAGFGIDKASLVIADIFNKLGFYVYVYRDYPSLIRGGHTFSIIRAAERKIGAHKDRVDLILALNQDTVDIHKKRLREQNRIIYDLDVVKSDGIGIQFAKTIKEEGAPEIARNIGLIGGMCSALGIERKLLEEVLRKHFLKDAEINIKIADCGYDGAKRYSDIGRGGKDPLPILTGNEALSLGLVKGGLDAYLAYPMTPSSPILHYLAGLADRFGIKVIHPESEIAVMLMALGLAYCGQRVAVGTSGGGFCLMTEGLSFSGMAELPVVVILGQRPGPSTGLPTYTCQTELQFALSAGQGEFVRFVLAPGDAEEAFYWAHVALNISTKYQIPSIILTDKAMAEGGYSFDKELIPQLKIEETVRWDRHVPYKRYQITESGVSPLAVPPDKDAIIKVSSYEHDEYGITTEDPKVTTTMQDKRLRRERALSEELEEFPAVNILGNAEASTALLCWGSNKGVCQEVGENFGLKVIQPIILEPFPRTQFIAALNGVKKIIVVENNATGQLEALIARYGFTADEKILKYDGRPFSVEELERKVREVVK